mgnify:CR=1 FL=1
MGKSKEELIARLILNTGRHIRPFSLNQIADDIISLSKYVGGLKEVSRLIGKSVDILRQFLSVKKLPKDIIELVKIRKIDKLQDVRYLNQFNSNDQKVVVNEIISGNLNTQDLKVLAPLRKRVKDNSITTLIKELKESKDKKIYLFFFKSKSKENSNKIKLKLQNLLGKENVINLEVSEEVYKLSLNEKGLKSIRNLAKENNLTLKKYFIKLISNL